MKSITVNLSGKCNAKCQHCCFSCSPSNPYELSREEVWSIVNYGIADENVQEISISGGEPFLQHDFLMALIKAISASGKTATCITNGYWAKSYDAAMSILKQLCDVGLKFLTISFDDFHSKYIAVSNIRNIAEAAVQLPIKIAFNMAVTRNNSGIKLLEELKDSLFGIPITRFPVVPIGSAHQISPDKLYYKIDLDRPLKCSESSYNMVIHHDGYVYPCCSPVVFESFLRIGSIRRYSLEALKGKLHSNILIYVIKKEGLDWFVSKCRAKGYDPLQKQYVSTCHLCGDLFKDDYVINLLRDDLREYYEKMLLPL